MKIGIIKEGKKPADNRVALTPAQCKWIIKNYPNVKILVQNSESRCFSDAEYHQAGIELTNDLSDCEIILGIKEIPIDMLLPGKTYLFFSHTKKKQPYNQKLMHAMMDKKITLIDYECLEHEDGQRIVGFGFFAGVVGAHNGLMAFGKRTGEFDLGRVFQQKDYRHLIHQYFGIKLPKIKIAVTGSGRVAKGIVEIMNMMDIQEVEPDDYLSKSFSYPVFVHLKSALLYAHKINGGYKRDDFHNNPSNYQCLFSKYISSTDILMNGIYWEKNIPSLFQAEDLRTPHFNIQTIADITDDLHGSVPCNLGDSTIEEPVYGVDKFSMEKTAPYLPTSVDMMAVGNLPNELPRDASRFFGNQLIKYVFEELYKGKSAMIDNATILNNGELTTPYQYLSDFATHG
ncbi:MAG: alanine dehydrogenase [Bacteroidetes bacterium]|nr:alanine dehydrogenase [Bacteroidota bacterium]